MFAVACIEEGMSLRAFGIEKPILIFSPLLPANRRRDGAERIEAVVRYGLTPTLVDEQAADDLAEEAQKQNTKIPVHIKIDTGMGRMGPLADKALALAHYVAGKDNIDIEGLYTHLATAEEFHNNWADVQMRLFQRVIGDLKVGGIVPPFIHAANSAAALARSDTHFDMIRPGISLYGYAPGEGIPAATGLKPVMKLISHIVFTKPVPEGWFCGYGRTFRASRPTKLAIVPIGYEDGYRRDFSNRAVMQVRGRFAPVIGRVSMDQTIIDVTDVPGADAGDEVIVVSNRREDPNSVEGLAQIADTIPYEITCLIGSRVIRVLEEERI
jgi:alanine racemase